MVWRIRFKKLCRCGCLDKWCEAKKKGIDPSQIVILIMFMVTFILKIHCDVNVLMIIYYYYIKTICIANSSSVFTLYTQSKDKKKI